MSKRFQQLGDTSILDTQTNEKYYAPNETELIDLLNEQQAEIDDLKEENEQLRKQNNELKLILKQHEFAEKEGFK